MNKRIRKKKQKQLEKCLLDLATAIDAGIQEYWRWRGTMQPRYAPLYAEAVSYIHLTPPTILRVAAFGEVCVRVSKNRVHLSGVRSGHAFGECRHKM